MDGIKIQKDIKDNCKELRDALLDISKWEKEMKDKESKLMHSSQDEKIPPVRSLNQQQTRTKSSLNAAKTDATVPTKKIENNDSSELKERANKFKEKGNSHVKIGEYEQAIYCYTDAINLLNSDPIFYTNRALCYLKLERYSECIEDCNRALWLNPKTVKAFYRRMQAHEFLGENDKALDDCKKILEIEPKNVEGNKSLERIAKKVEERKEKAKVNRSLQSTINKPVGKPTFSELKNNMKIVKTVTKPAHLRSKKALKRIAIKEIMSSPATNEKDTKNVENSSIASNNNNSHISDEVIEKLFNSNEYSNYKQVHKKKTPENPEPYKESVVPPSHNVPPVPQSTGQFYVTWKGLSPENKYLYLRNIEPSNINKILGAGLDSETLSDILGILSEYYIQNQADVHKVLFELSKHSEVAILSLFLSEEDRAALSKLIAYMQERKDCVDDIVSIKSKFCL